MKIQTNIDLNNNQLQKVALYPLASDPNTAGWGAAQKGIVWFNTTDNIFRYWDGSAIKDFCSRSELLSAIEGLAWKDDCVAATTGNVTIATALNNGDTIDNVTLATGDRVLVKSQTDKKDNGIYIVGVTPTRSLDTSASAEFNNAIIPIAKGDTNAGTNWRCIDYNPDVGTDDIEFESFGTAVPDATESVKGKVELATDAEAKARSSDSVVITPGNLAEFPLMFSADFNNTSDWAGGAAPYTITIAAATHGCGASKKLMPMVFEDGSPNTLVTVDISVSDAGIVVISSNEKFAGHYVVMGIA